MRARPRSLHTLLVALMALGPLGGCDFFKELEDAEQDETGDTSETGESGETGDAGDVCQLGVTDYCASQDDLITCDPETSEEIEFDCAYACAPNINVSCFKTPSYISACWCAAPGDQKIDSCSQLETCLGKCGVDAWDSCGEACFARTTATTVRLYGALLACAEKSCVETCAEEPAACGNCLASARAGYSGDCAVERSLCDQDENDDAWP